MKKLLISILLLGICSIAYAVDFNTSVLDNFNRANELPLTGNWANITDDWRSFQVWSNVAYGAGETGYNGVYRTDTTYGADQEVYFTIIDSVDRAGFFLRLTPGAVNTEDGYWVWYDASTQNTTLELMVDGGRTTLLTINQAFSANDKIGAKIIGQNLSVYRMPSGGSWTYLNSVINSTLSGENTRIGMYSNSTNFGLDNFGGGNATIDGGVTSTNSQIIIIQ